MDPMEEQLIVSKLNEPPFNFQLSLVDFDEKEPKELLNVMKDVFQEIEPQMKEVRNGSPEEFAVRMLALLQVFKYKIPQDETARELFQATLAAGEKTAVYPILHWALQRLPGLKKRAYLARFLLPVDVPQEYLQAGDETLAHTYDHYKQLQEEFKGVHKQVDQVRQNPAPSKDLKLEITTLEDEKKQLLTKIEKLKRSNENDSSFDELLKATNKLRLQQDEEARLADNMRKQQQALKSAEQKRQETIARLEKMRRGAGADAATMLDSLQEEVGEMTRVVEEQLPREVQQAEAKLAQLQEGRFEPQRTERDIKGLAEANDDLERSNAQRRDAVEQRMGRSADNKLSMFRQQANMVLRKCEEKESAVEALNEEKNRLSRDIEEKEQRMSEIGGAKFMTREEFKRYGAQLREKTHLYKKCKGELNDLRSESVVLHRTEQILRSRVSNLESFLGELEARRGVRGYRDVQDKVERASEATAAVDAEKEKTLEEISNLVRDITQQLKERKSALAPQIKKLREVRNQYQQVEVDYLQKKSTYDKVAVGLEVERQQLEQECDAFQDECLQEESRYHYLHQLVSMSEVNARRIADEEKWKAGEGRLLPNFRNYEELYTERLSQQTRLSEQLRKQKATLEKHERPNLQQRALFSDLHKLLTCKHKLMERGAFGGEAKVGFGSSELDIGNARVMKINEAL